MKLTVKAMDCEAFMIVRQDVKRLNLEDFNFH